MDQPEELVDWTAQITPIARVAHDVWVQPGERRRMRAYGFRPTAHEDGVLKRDWHGTEVRVGVDGIVAAGSEGTLRYDAASGALLFDEAPFDASSPALRAADLLVSLINDYERWVEVREGRASRLRRTKTSSSDVRPINAIAETRRLQRMLGTAWGRPPSRRR